VSPASEDTEKKEFSMSGAQTEGLRELAKQMGDAGYCNYEACLEYLEKASRLGALAALEQAAQLAEDSNVPEGFRGTSIYTEFERGGDEYLTQIAGAIRALATEYRKREG
jgi:hypothetical protein